MMTDHSLSRPWLELNADALRRNVHEVARLARGRPIVGVVKNNAYGLGLARVGPVLDALPEIVMLAVVRPAEAFALRDAGVGKPILLMGPCTVDEGVELARHDVCFAPYTDDAGERLREIARRAQLPVRVQLYIDTGMRRMGMPAERALPWIEALARQDGVHIEGAFTELAESDADVEQLARFHELLSAAKTRGVDIPHTHAASSHGLFFRNEATLAAIRVGLVLYGAYPAGARALGSAQLQPALSLRAPVVRVEQIQPGEGVSYSRNYVAERPTWIATLPVGHGDGYPRAAVNGGEVLVRGRPYRVIGAVSAGHTVIEIGDERTVETGDVATLVGSEHPAVHPNTLAERAGISVYDVLMHLNPSLPGPVSGEERNSLSRGAAERT